MDISQSYKNNMKCNQFEVKKDIFNDEYSNQKITVTD